MSTKGPTILVTGTGGGVGKSILKCLEESPGRLVALDTGPHAAGLYVAARGRVVSHEADPGYDALHPAICVPTGWVVEPVARVVAPGLAGSSLPGRETSDVGRARPSWVNGPVSSLSSPASFARRRSKARGRSRMLDRSE